MGDDPILHRWRLSARQRRWLDIALVVALLVFVPGYAFVDHGAIAVVLSIAQIVPLLWRRDHAIAAFVAVGVASAV